jgi:phenol 2-monooxygenase (NADPH)
MVDYEKIFCPDPKAGDIFDLRNVNRDTGCVVVVRPDQYVAHVLPLDEHEALARFFAGVLVDAIRPRPTPPHPPAAWSTPRR